MKVSSNTGCNNGDKFVIKNNKEVNRRQFLFVATNATYVESVPILAFVPRGQTFPDCPSYTQVTTAVECKVNIETYSISIAF